MACEVLAKEGRLGFSVAQGYHAGPLVFINIANPCFFGSKPFSLPVFRTQRNVIHLPVCCLIRR